MGGRVNAADRELHLIVELFGRGEAAGQGLLQRVPGLESGYFGVSWTFAMEDSMRWRLAA